MSMDKQRFRGLVRQFIRERQTLDMLTSATGHPESLAALYGEDTTRHADVLAETNVNLVKARHALDDAFFELTNYSLDLFFDMMVGEERTSPATIARIARLIDPEAYYRDDWEAERQRSMEVAEEIVQIFRHSPVADIQPIDEMTVINELKYIFFHVVWLCNSDATKSVVEWREVGSDGEYIVRKSFEDTENPLTGNAAQEFNNMCWEAMTLGSRSEMLRHVRIKGIEI